MVLFSQKAKNLKMNNTLFKNCHGIDEDEHLTTSHDIAIISSELLNKHPEITKYTTTWIDYLRNGKSELVNTNKLSIVLVFIVVKIASSSDLIPLPFLL